MTARRRRYAFQGLQALPAARCLVNGAAATSFTPSRATLRGAGQLPARRQLGRACPSPCRWRTVTRRLRAGGAELILDVGLSSGGVLHARPVGRHARGGGRPWRRAMGARHEGDGAWGLHHQWRRFLTGQERARLSRLLLPERGQGRAAWSTWSGPTATGRCRIRSMRVTPGENRGRYPGAAS